MRTARIAAAIVGVLLGCSGDSRAQPNATSPLTVELGPVKQNANNAVLNAGITPVGGPYEVAVTIYNDGDKALTVDAFSLGDGVLAVWEPAADGLSTRIMLSPQGQHRLRLRLVSAGGLQKPAAILFMQEWKEVGRIDILFTKVDSPRSEDFPFGFHPSGMGKEAAHYRFCTKAAPVGFEIARATPYLVQAPNEKEDPRGCLSWAACPTDTPKTGEGACFAPWVQGHSEGDSHAKDRVVMFGFGVTVEYRAIPPTWTLTSRDAILRASQKDGN